MKVDKGVKLFFLLLHDALWHSEGVIPQELSEVECESLFALAEKQAVLGLVADALVRHNVKMPQIYVFKAVGVIEQIKGGNRRVNKGVVKLQRLMEEAEVDYAVIKGQAVATYYPDELLRQSGDIDYYCDNKNFQKGVDAARNIWGVQAEIHGSEKHADYDYQGNRYEGHFVLTNLHVKKNNRYLHEVIDSAPKEEVLIDDAEIKTLSPTQHTLFVFLHLYFHLVEVGVGLRQFCDLAMLLKEDINREQLKQHLEALGMDRAFRACEYILKECLGMPEVYLPYPIRTSDNKNGQRMLDVVLYRGNMGHYNKRNGWSGIGHQVESACIKISHFVKFFWLSPGFHLGWMGERLKAI